MITEINNGNYKKDDPIESIENDSICESPTDTEEKIKKIKKDMNEISNSIANFIESVEHKLTYKEYISMLERTIDQKIIQNQINQNVSFVGGKLKLAVDHKNKFVNFKVEYYYKNQSDQWVTNSELGKTRISKFNLKDNETVNFLKSSDIDEFTVDPPEEKQ